MKFLKALLEDADNYLPNPMMAYGFTMQDLAIIRSAKGNEEELSSFMEDDTYKGLREKTRRFLVRHGKLNASADTDEFCTALCDDPRF